MLADRAVAEMTATADGGDGDGERALLLSTCLACVRRLVDTGDRGVVSALFGKAAGAEAIPLQLVDALIRAGPTTPRRRADDDDGDPVIAIRQLVRRGCTIAQVSTTAMAAATAAR